MYNKKYSWISVLLFLNPIMVYSTNSWFSLWMHMEFNMLIFIMYLIMNNDNLGDLPMKYFLINSFSSIVFMLMIHMYLIYKFMLFMYIVNLMMLVKLGMFPFHYWFVDMMMKLNWESCFLLSIWQKLIPLMILYMLNLIMMNFFMILINSLFSMIMSYNEMNLKKIMSYSSINHLTWMIVSMFYSMKLFMIYYIIYILINLVLMYNFNNLNFNYILDFVNIFYLSKTLMILMVFMIFSLGGLPPFWGFYMKFMVIMELVTNYTIFVIFILILSSLIYLYYYLRVVLNYMMMNFMLLKYLINMKFSNNNLLMILHIMVIFNFFFVFIWLLY